MEKEVFSVFQILFLLDFLVAGLHISLSDILDKKIGLREQIFNYLAIQEIVSITKIDRQILVKCKKDTMNVT